MSNKTSISLMLVIFLAGLAGIAWIASTVSGYRFGSAFTGVIAGYILLLVTYACWRRAAVTIRGRRSEGRPPRIGRNDVKPFRYFSREPCSGTLQ